MIPQRAREPQRVGPGYPPVSHRICTHSHRTRARTTDSFLGRLARQGPGRSILDRPTALILMGDWCGWSDTARPKHRDCSNLCPNEEDHHRWKLL